MFFYGFAQLQRCFTPMWERAGAGRAVACMYPRDAAGLAFRTGFEPLLRASGYQVVDGGAYDDGTGDYARLVSLFQSRQCGVYTNASLPADFAGFWRQAARRGYRPRLATVTNVAQFPDDAAALGPASAGIATAAWWVPAMPYVSALTGESAQALAAAYQAETGRAWVQTLGSSYALFEVAIEALRSVSDPHDKQQVAGALHKLSYHGMCGPLDFATGPAPGVAVIEPVGAQWKPAPGKYPFALEVVDHSLNPAVPVGAALAPTT
jgi:branched-chain amino acid transport system substrate-binding protein